ncbi:hypothetical protein EYZ11_007885 [Aspergillus tanneri]|nr:hypothetical protein EYZ11_007885 [Aspergillus tanneri]
MTSADTASLPSSQEERASSAAGIRSERHESMTKSLFNRGSRILRRQGSKFSIAATVDEEDEMEREKSRFEVFGRHQKSRQSYAHDNLKSLISDPFDFHHLTHTSPSHFQALERAPETDLVTEFSAIRASQRPVTGLKGIRADDLHFRDFSSEDFTNCGTAIVGDLPDPVATSPPASLGAVSPSSAGARSPKDTTKLPRESRVFENFSRPVSRYPRFGESTTPPPRATSPRLAASPEIPEPAPRAIDEILGLSSQQTYPEHVYSHDDDVQPDSSFANMSIEAMFPTVVDHTISSGPAKDTADATRVSSLSFTNMSSDLDDVPEEEEATHWHDSPVSHAENVASRVQSPSSSLLTGTQSAFVARSKSQLSIYVAEELSKKFSEALGSPTLPQYCMGSDISRRGQEAREIPQRRPSIRLGHTYETIHESWDADIDYCYEHAAESNSNFDWAHNSLDEPRSGKIGIPATTLDPRNSPERGQGRRLLPSVHLSCTLPSPDLDPSPPRFQPRDGECFQPVSSSIFPSTLGKHVTQDTLYEEYLSADAESDRHFSFCSQGVIQPMEHHVSPRSSFSPISKCNSQESLILSRAASIVRKHRSSVSTASVPELVHSLANSRELPLTDQIHSGEYPVPSGPPSVSGLARADSTSHHRQTMSLAREIEYQVFSRADNAGHKVELAPSPSPSIHDRAKSTSDVEAAPLVSKAVKDEASFRGAQRRKGRTTSYSLFPSTVAN